MGILQSIPLYPFSDDLSSPLTLMWLTDCGVHTGYGNERKVF